MSYRQEVMEESINLIKSFENDSLFQAEIKGETPDEDLSIHMDSAESLAIGYGLDLLLNSREQLISIFNQANEQTGEEFDYEELRLFERIADYRRLTETRARETFVRQNTNIRLPGLRYANAVFHIVANDKFRMVEQIVNNGVDTDYYSLLGIREKSAIFSMAYNTGYGLFYEKVNGRIDFNRPYNSLIYLREYLDNKDSENIEERKTAIEARTRVWYEIRYNSCQEAWNRRNGGEGLAKRRYVEGDIFQLYDEETITPGEASWILDKLRDESITRVNPDDRRTYRSIESIATVFEENFYAPDSVERHRRLNDPMKGIADIIKDLDKRLKMVLCNLSNTAENLQERFYPDGEWYEVREYEENTSSKDCPVLEDYDLSQARIEEGREKIYLSANDAIYQELRNRFENNYGSDYRGYLEAKTGKEIEIEYYQESEDNTALLNTLLENYHDNFDISRQDNFDYFRVINGKIGLIDILNYIILSSEEENEGDKFQIANSILAGIDWEGGEFNNIGQVDLATANENNEENKYYRLLKTFSDNREQIYSADSYTNIVSLDKKLLVDFIAEQMGGNIENGFDNLSRDFIYWYHEEAEVSLPGELYNALTGISENYSIIHLLNYIKGKSKSSEFMNGLIADKTYETFLEENFEESEHETVIENDKRVMEGKDLINKFSAYSNIRRFLEEIDNYTDTDPVEQIIAEAEERGRKVDNLTVAFLENYNAKYGIKLVNEDPIYNITGKIREDTDVLIFPLMYRTVVLMEKEADKTDDDELYRGIKTFADRCKDCLEEVIKEKGDYAREHYKEDNDRDLTDYQLKNELINAFEPQRFASVDTERSHEFFKSFLTAEDEEKSLAEMEEEKEKQRKEDSKKQAEEEEARRRQYARERKERMREEKEREKKSQGWKLYCENGRWKIEERSDYYKV